MSLLFWRAPTSSQLANVPSADLKEVGGAPSNTTTVTDAGEVEIPFEDIVARFNGLSQDVLQLQQKLAAQSEELKSNIAQLKAAHAQNQKHESALRDLRKTLQQERTYTALLQEAISGPRKQKLIELRKQGPTQGFIKELASQRNAQSSEVVKLNKSVQRLNEGHGMLQRQLNDTEQRLDNALAVNKDLKLDLECIKYTVSPPTPDPQQNIALPVAPLPEVPFILVLIDGDAYRFDVTQRSTQPNALTHPATRIARNIKNHVQSYILEHELPPHCKLFVRALRNVSGARRNKDHVGVVHRASRTLSPQEDFMITFTESAPLFDYYDAGAGKERVDGKIHELYHTFIANPSCKKIFLAASSDNGFARMLEQYTDHPHARAKTCLIDSGHTASEIARLDLETVEWPSVFCRRFKPREAQMRDSRREAKRLAEQTKLDDKISEVGREEYERLLCEAAIARVTRDLTGAGDARVVVRRLVERDGRRRTHGVRVRARSVGSLESSDMLEPLEHDGHDEYCTDDGVD